LGAAIEQPLKQHGEADDADDTPSSALTTS